MPDRYAHLTNAVFDHPWAILPSKLAAMVSLLELRSAGLTLTEQDIQARIGGSSRRTRDDLEVTAGGVGILPIFGVLAQRLSLMKAISGGTSTESIGADFQTLRDDPKVKAIVLAVDSPGGSCYGLDELATELRTARGSKPIIAAIDSLAASGGYWLASQADSVSITPGGDAGHIGVITAHDDLTSAAEKLGVKTTLFTAGPFKSEGHPLQPLTDEARAAIQHRVDQAYTRFVRAVAAGRGVTEAAVRTGFGQGRLLSADDALAAGLVDRIEAFDAVIARLEQQTVTPSARGSMGPRAEQPSTKPSSSDDTRQEPPAATRQDRRRDDAWRYRAELELLDL
jgi:signal peptide peptidase SppA